LHNSEIYYSYSSPDFIRTIKERRKRLAGQVAFLGKEKYLILLSKPAGKRPLGSSMPGAKTVYGALRTL
jgi:hypothetical protein